MTEDQKLASTFYSKDNSETGYETPMEVIRIMILSDLIRNVARAKGFQVIIND